MLFQFQERVEAEGMDYAEFLKKMKKDKRNLFGWSKVWDDFVMYMFPTLFHGMVYIYTLTCFHPWSSQFICLLEVESRLLMVPSPGICKHAVPLRVWTSGTFATELRIPRGGVLILWQFHLPTITEIAERRTRTTQERYNKINSGPARKQELQD